MKHRVFNIFVLGLALLPAVGFSKSHFLGEEVPVPAMEASQALGAFSGQHKLVRHMRFQKPASLDIKQFSETIVTGLASVDGQVFFTMEKKGPKWVLKDLTIPLNSYEVAESSSSRSLTEKQAWQHASRDFAKEIVTRGLVPHQLNWLRMTADPRQGVELIFKGVKDESQKLRLIYRTSDLSLVLYSSDPDGSPIKGLVVPGSMPRHIEPITVPSSVQQDPAAPAPSLAQISSAGFCLAGLGAVVFLLITTVAQSIKVQKLTQR